MSLPPVFLRVLGHRYGATALVLLALPSLYGLAELTRPSGAVTERAGGRLAVQSAVVACPSVDGARVGVLSTGGGTGRTDLTSVPSGAVVPGPAGPGGVWIGQPSGVGVLEARASGGSAAGFEVEQNIWNRSGDDRGLAGVRCAVPGTDAWFLGPGPVSARQLVLTLTDVDDQPATVDLQALSDVGPMVTTDGLDTEVAPGTTQQIVIGASPAGLAPIVASAQLLALHVQAVSGRVASSLEVRVDKGKGIDWEPQTAEAATRLVVPAVPAGAGDRRLLLSVPGTSDAKVQVQLVTPAGLEPQGGPEEVTCPGQTVTSVPLEGLLSGQAAAAVITSNQPVLAGLSLGSANDVAYGAATEPLNASGGVIADVGQAGTTDTLVLTAPQGAAKVRITTVTAQGRVADPQVVEVGAARTISVPLTPQGDSGVLVQPEPGSGPVYAGRTLTAPGGLMTELPIEPALTSVMTPPVVQSPS